MEGTTGADVFFWLTGGALIVLALAGLALLFYVWRMIRELKRLISFLGTHARLLADDLQELRSDARLKGRSWLRLSRTFVGLFRKRKGR